MNVLGVSLAPYVRSSKSLQRWVKPFAVWYSDVMGYRKVGLRYDDLLCEENDQVQKALGRLTEREAFDRAYRFKVASHCSVLHTTLPKDQWLPVSEDVRYLLPYVLDVIKEDEERATWDSMSVQKK